MLTNKLLVFVMLIAVATGSVAASLDEQWGLKRDRDGVQVYTAAVAGSPYDAVLTRTVVERLPLASLLAVIKDAEACARADS